MESGDRTTLCPKVEHDVILYASICTLILQRDLFNTESEDSRIPSVDAAFRYKYVVPVLIACCVVTFSINVVVIAAFPLVRNVSRVRKTQDFVRLIRDASKADLTRTLCHSRQRFPEFAKKSDLQAIWLANGSADLPFLTANTATKKSSPNTTYVERMG